MIGLAHFFDNDYAGSEGPSEAFSGAACAEKLDVDPSQGLSAAEAARYLGVGRKMIYQLIDFGELRAARQRGRLISSSRVRISTETGQGARPLPGTSCFPLRV